ncbi:MAG TPA: glycosyltransferase family A protein [Pseudomonadales bacterium]|nr:glycosyltransferase family A protein [Pseudomonadales bacterium]
MTDNSPRLSFIVVVYNMQRQAMNTLYSLSARHQRNVREQDYEIIVVENNSASTLSEVDVLALGNNIRYFLRNETSQSPVGAINFGAAQARGNNICLMVDGARMVTPRVVEYGLMAIAADSDALVAVPGYSLGWQDQHHHLDAAYDEQVEMALLAETNWQQNGYRLFDIATISGANPNGCMNPLMECNCVMTSARNFAAIGGANPDFQLPGGGSINLHIFRQLGLLPDSRHYFVMAGEGSFHQFHGGITTAQWSDLEEVLESHRKQLHSYWENTFHSLRREPMLLGACESHAQKFLQFASQKSQKRLRRLERHGQQPWPDDPRIEQYKFDY